MTSADRKPSGRRALLALLATLIACALGGCFLLPGAPPVAVIAVDRVEGTAPLDVRFDASDSYDEDGIVTTFAWTFGDGTSEHGTILRHVFPVPGTYSVELMVLDDDGHSDVAAQTIIVHEPAVPPTAVFTAAPSTVAIGEPVAFDASASFDPDGRILSYLWDFGDGSTGSGASIAHGFSTPGTFPVTLTVVDNDGARSSHVLSVLVADTNTAPVASFTIAPDSAGPGEIVRFDASDSYDADGEIATVRWTFGDGRAGAGAVVEHVYAASGSYRVDLLVTDNLGASRLSSRVLTITAPGAAPGTPGETLVERYTWTYDRIPRQLMIEIPMDLLAFYRSQPRGVWPARDYDEYVLDPQDDVLMSTLAIGLDLGDYYATVENALFFVQQCIGYQADPGPFEYPRYPMETLVDRVGDCEDTAILFASLLRTLGHGALLVSVDTSGSGSPNHMGVLVPVDAAFCESFPCGSRSFWEIGGRLYAYAETAVEGGSLELGVDPWNLGTGDLDRTWDVARAGAAPKRIEKPL